MSAPRTFDRDLIRRHLIRARTSGYADFLLARCADDLADRLAVVTRDFARAADIGTPTRLVAEMLAADPRIGQMMRVAPVAEPGAGAITDMETLPLEPASLNLVVSLLALHDVNDLPGTLTQLRLALQPDGLMIAALPGGQTLTELRQCLIAAESEITGGISPRVAPFADIRDMGGLLQRAGFALPVADSETITVRYASVFGLMADLRAMGWTNALHERSRKPLRRAVLLRMAQLYAERFADADGRIRATFEILWLSGWAPHASQQQPLKPGSAKARLADALKVPELPAGEKAGG
jgi:SAM-dependent methyltransferase